jgi:sterol desaturase/sphingolipid hydroxylase (fatty acid hydroxylase superfamily)
MPITSLLLPPLLVSSVVAATLALLELGLPPPAVSGSVLVASVLLMLVLERVTPLHEAWNRRPEGLDLLLLVGNRLIDVGVIAGTLALVAALAPLRQVQVWPTALPLPLQALLGMVIGEALRYALHRLSHRPGFLWRVHRTHHEPERMYTLNGPRLHPVNHLWIATANVVPMLLLGAELAAVVLAANVTAFFVLFQHANLGLRFPVWGLVVATPDVHRLHHAREGSETPVNLGIVFLVFDHLFGTYRAAGDEIGVDEIGLAPPAAAERDARRSGYSAP